MSNKKIEQTTHFTFSKSLYDECNIKKKEQESTGPFKWITDSVYESPSACFLDESPFMHNNFYSIPSNKVDVESDLRNQTRLLTRCPEGRFNPLINSTSCPKFNSGLPCECKDCKEAKKVFELHDCEKSGLIPESTRTKRPCNILSGISINRFDPLYEDLQDSQKIQSNSFIGVNTRMQVKDAYKKTQEKK